MSDPIICENIEKEIQNYFLLNENCGVSSGTVWDAFKAVIRGNFISVAASCKKTKMKTLLDLRIKIAYLKAKHLRCGGKKTLKKWEIERKKLALYETSQTQRSLLFLKEQILF